MKKNEHEEIQSFLKTGITESYEFSNPSVRKIHIGKMFPHFDGTEITVDQRAQKWIVICISAVEDSISALSFP